MAAFVTARTENVSNGQFGLILAHTWGRVSAWNAARKTRKVLSELTDRELEDIGLIRRDIHSIT
ncbi:MAG: DUF1127 domain-containing protein [Pseudomonadota bacterium]|nr:DUF1127 domain-containing protein [Pseudomonadota bacterium]